MRNLFFLLFILGYQVQSFGQLEEDLQIRATAIPIGVDLEKSIGEKWSINFDASLVPSLVIDIDQGIEQSTETSVFLSPFVQTSIRNYFSFDRRERKNKKTSGNSSNYVGFQVQNLFKTLGQEEGTIFESDNVFSAGFVWGIQRTYDSNLYLDFNLGLGFASYEFSDDSIPYNGASPISSFSFGYAFNQD